MVRTARWAPCSAPGRVGWHELLSGDWQKAIAFYGDLFGWQEVDLIDIGEMGKYQIFSAGGQTLGGMFNKPPMLPVSFWLYYINVSDIDAAAERVKVGRRPDPHGPDASAGRRLDPPGQGPAGRGVRAVR